MSKEIKSKQRSFASILLYRLSQFIGFLLSIHIFTTIILIVALYVSTFFLFSNVEHYSALVFDYKVHGIIASSLFSILAGRIINQFYDKEKDALSRPFNSKFQHFLKQKYYLYTYVVFNILSLVIGLSVSHRVFIFFLVYQFFIWFYSHKLSKILMVNNLTFVALTLYPFFGVLVYYKAFSSKVFLLAVFLFLMLWILDIVKDVLTKNVDKVFGYQTLPNVVGSNYTKGFIILLLSALMVDTIVIVDFIKESLMTWYFMLSGIISLLSVVLVIIKTRHSWLILLNLLRFWIFIGIIFMLVDGIYTHFQV